MEPLNDGSPFAFWDAITLKDSLKAFHSSLHFVRMTCKALFKWDPTRTLEGKYHSILKDFMHQSKSRIRKTN
ncbi:hypothetical protein Leryth_017838 [Lithospermum erythrorhizon]|nr:hypothetical protein Leryth_017838 [Lithospermum erythrorhizon]